MACTVHRRLTTSFTRPGSGGGVGGLTLAVALSKYPDIEVEVFEAARQFTEVGAGVGILPRPLKVQDFCHNWLVDRILTVSSCLKVLRKLGTGIEHALLNAATDFEWTEDFGMCIG